MAARMPRHSWEPPWYADEEEHFCTFHEKRYQWERDLLKFDRRRLTQERALGDRYRAQGQRALATPHLCDTTPACFAPFPDILP